MTETSDFPTAGLELTHLLVVGDLARSQAFYRDVLGALCGLRLQRKGLCV